MTLQKDLWRIRLDEEPIEGDLHSLDALERARADRFKFADDRRRFIRSHVAVRHILSRYCGIAPARIPLDVAARGKPRIAGGRAPAFNLSHSGEWALLAIQSDADVQLGVDIEKIQAMSDRTALAARYFCDAEISAMQELPDEASRDAAFLACWTRKEAYVKALGTGLGEGELREMPVGLSGRVRIGPITIESVDAGPGVAAAIASSAGIGPLKLLEYSVEFPAR